jgi:hypothetical protein
MRVARRSFRSTTAAWARRSSSSVRGISIW